MPPACFLNAPTNRLSSCAAAAHIINGRTNSAVRYWHQRQRRWSKDDPFNQTKKKTLRERVASGHKFAQEIVRKEVKKPLVSSGSFGYFSSCWEKWAAGGRPRARKREKSQYEKTGRRKTACFAIIAQKSDYIERTVLRKKE